MRSIGVHCWHIFGDRVANVHVMTIMIAIVNNLEVLNKGHGYSQVKSEVTNLNSHFLFNPPTRSFKCCAFIQPVSLML